MELFFGVYETQLHQFFISSYVLILVDAVGCTCKGQGVTLGDVGIVRRW